MANFICEAHFWSCNDNLPIPDNTTAYHKYYSKKHTKTIFSEEKIAYSESRNVLCKPENKFRENLLLAIQNIDEILIGAEVLKIQWISRSVVELILTNGSILSIIVNQFSGDILHVHKDLTFANSTKYLASVNVCDVLITDSFLIASYHDLNEISMFTFSSPRFDPKKVDALVDIVLTKDEKPKINKISVDQKFSTGFAGPNGSHPKQLSFNHTKTLVLMWFSGHGVNRNIFIFFPGRAGLELVATTLTPGFPNYVQFSASSADMIISVESSPLSSSTIINKLRFFKGQMTVTNSIDVPTKSQLVSCDWSTNETRTALATEGKELFMYCSSMKVTRSTKLSYNPHVIRWMPNNCCVMVIGKLGEIQLFDVALNPLKLLVNGSVEDLFSISGAFNGMFLEVVAIGTNMCMERKALRLMDVNECIIISTKKGPITMVTLSLGVTNNARGLSSSSIFNQHLLNGRILEAHELLKSLDWSYEANACMYSLSSFVNHLMRLPPTHDVINYIQSALSTFYSSTNGCSEIVAMEYGEAVTNLARRYFRLLMRLKMFEKCYLIACDIQHKDLFMELYYAARDLGETSLAESSRRAAMELEEETLEFEFQPDDRDSLQSLDSLDSLYTSPHLSQDEEQDGAETRQVNDRDIISQLIKDTETITMNDLCDEFTQSIQ